MRTQPPHPVIRITPTSGQVTNATDGRSGQTGPPQEEQRAIDGVKVSTTTGADESQSQLRVYQWTVQTMQGSKDLTMCCTATGSSSPDLRPAPCSANSNAPG